MTAALLDRTSVRLPDNRSTRRPSGPKLRVLDQAATRRRARHRSALLILFIAVLTGFFAVAFVHAELVAGQHDLDAVRAEISQAEARHAELARTVEEASAPATIVTRATELGMVRARQPVYLTAAAPLRTIEAGPSLQSPTATRSDVDGSIAQVAVGDPAVSGESTAADDRLRGSIGQAGGISAAIRIQNTPAVALGADESPAGTSTATADQTAATAVATTAPPADPTPGGPASSIAGTRAASTPAGATAASAPAQPVPSSPVGASLVDSGADQGAGTGSGAVGVTAGTSAATSSTNAGSSGTNPAGGLASAAATTSG